MLAPSSKSFILGVNEYAQTNFKTDAHYVFSRAYGDYAVTAILDGLTYVTAFHPNKITAKILAAKAVAEVILPEYRPRIEKDEPDPYGLRVYDSLEIDDENVPDLTKEHEEIQPYNVLLACMARNFGYDQSDIKAVTSYPANTTPEFSLTVGTYKAAVPVSIMAKQEAAQAIVCEIHPYLRTWGAVIRMYFINKAFDYQELQAAMPHTPPRRRKNQAKEQPKEEQGEPPSNVVRVMPPTGPGRGYEYDEQLGAVGLGVVAFADTGAVNARVMARILESFREMQREMAEEDALDQAMGGTPMESVSSGDDSDDDADNITISLDAATQALQNFCLGRPHQN